MLSRTGHVIKTNIDPIEKRFIRERPTLEFKVEDAVNLSFQDNAFDLVYSISVIEHIYEAYPSAVNEMVRVAKPGGLIYLTFPVASSHVEEWLDYPAYPSQEKSERGFFFQYRFSEAEMDSLVGGLGTEIVAKHVYWERRPGLYDNVMRVMRKTSGVRVLDIMRNAILNLYSGFFLLEESPDDFIPSRAFGTACVVLRKKVRVE